MQNKLKQLAKIIVNYSLKVKENDKILISYQNAICNDLVLELIEELNKKNAIIFVNLTDQAVGSKLKEITDDKRIELIRKYQQFEFDNFDSFINIKYNHNDYEGKNIDPNITKQIVTKTYDIHEKKINKRKWVLLNYPSIVDSYKASMPYKEFYCYALDVMTLNYEAMSHDVLPLKELMEATNMVRIVSPNTDITFSIKDLPVIPCVGDYNLPDGEVFTSPVKKSVNGKITYNTKTTHDGDMYENICLEFKDGKIVSATCSDPTKIDKLNKIFDVDNGSRYVGEFAIGINPKVLDPVGDILYDEKIIGSIHFTPGSAYKDSYNGNDSALHWDLVLIQRKEYGGGELYFDDVLVRKDGIFVLKELEHLNYNN